MSGIHLLKNFVKNPTSIGSIWPSSSFLAETITSGINLENSSSIVELGPGTGVFTEYILKKKKKGAAFFVVELNSELCAIVKKKYPTLKLYNESAANLRSIKEQEKLDHIETVISGLPWATFPKKLQTNILDAVYACIEKNGTFTTFSYLQGSLLPSAIKFRKLLKKYFSEIKTSKIVWRNLPPAYVYRCTGKM